MHLGDRYNTWSMIVFLGAALGIYYLARAFPRFFPALGALLVLAVASTAIVAVLAALGAIPQSTVPVAIYCSIAAMLIACAVGFVIRRQKRRPKV